MACCALAVIIALIGIANTLALSVHERTRELGLLRAVGMTRRQVRTLVRWESVMIAVLGTGLGLLLALAGVVGDRPGTRRRGHHSVVVPGTRIAMIVGIARSSPASSPPSARPVAPLASTSCGLSRASDGNC